MADGPEPADRGGRHLPASRRRRWSRADSASCWPCTESHTRRRSTDVQRGHYCAFLKHALKRIPKIRDVVVWNEVNSPDFWPAAGGAVAYEALFAECWDRLRGLRPYVNLISSTAARNDPAGFMRAVGVAYRQSGRKRPIVSTFGHNPYPVNAAEPPWVRHDDPTNVSQADLPRLLLALHKAFDGTGQPLPSASRPSVWYLENGFQTTVSGR